MRKEKNSLKPETLLMIDIFGLENYNQYTISDSVCWENIDGQSLRQALEEALDSITFGRRSISDTRNKELILRRYGFYGPCWTFRQLGTHFEVSRNRMWQQTHRAIRLLRHPSRSKILRRYIMIGH